jgi:dCTP diphosphatase
MNIEHLNLLLKNFADERQWNQFHSPKNLSMALCVEASELLEIFQWETEDASRQLHLDSEKKEMISDEIADIFLYLLQVAKKCEIDLEKAALHKIKKNALKYPIK